MTWAEPTPLSFRQQRERRRERFGTCPECGCLLAGCCTAEGTYGICTSCKIKKPLPANIIVPRAAEDLDTYTLWRDSNAE